jgi:hypothetical protein
MGAIDPQNSQTSSLLAIAEMQGGHINRAQLRGIGFTNHQIRHLTATGFLIRVYHNVYAVGRRATKPEDLAHAALLAIGERCALAGGSAASLWGVQKRWDFPLEVITPLNRRPKGLIVHQSKVLLQSDVTLQNHLKVITPALAVLQLAPTVTTKQLERAIDDLRLQHRLTLEQLHALIPALPPTPRRVDAQSGPADRSPRADPLRLGAGLAQVRGCLRPPPV